VCCSVVQRVWQCVAACLQCVAVCCSVLQCACCSVGCSVLQCAAVCHSSVLVHFEKIDDVVFF